MDKLSKKLMKLIEKLNAVKIREAIIDGVGLVRHYLLPDGRVVEIVFR